MVPALAVQDPSQPARSRRGPTKSSKSEDASGEESRGTARPRPYPEPKSHKANTATKKQAKGATERKAASVKGKKAQAKGQGVVEEEDAEGEDAGVEEEQGAKMIQRSLIQPQTQPAPVAPRSYYPPSAHPQHYEITDSPPGQKAEEIHPQPQYQSYHEEPVRPHRPTGSLASLADGPEGPEGRPPYPYSTLIRYAIEGSERGKLTLSELYTHIEARFPWFGKNGAGWKNSIRHNLSLNKSFVKIPRPLTEPGKGSYWCINYSVTDAEAGGEGGAPEPKRKRKKKDDTVGAHSEPASGTPTIESAPPPLAPSVYENPYPNSGYEGQPAAHAYGYPPQQAYPPPSYPPQQQAVQEAGEEAEEYDEEDGQAEQEPAAPYQQPPNAAYYPQQQQQQYAYQHPSAPPVQQHSAPVENMYPHPSQHQHQQQPHPQQSYYAPHGYAHQQQQHAHAPYPVQADPSQVPPQHPQAGFVDDRPDRSAPRTIYNHAGGGPYGMPQQQQQQQQPLGALATSVPHVNMNTGHPHMYGYAYGYHPGHQQQQPQHVSPRGYTSSLGGAMGPPSGQA